MAARSNYMRNYMEIICLKKRFERFDKIWKISREATKTKKKQQLNLKTR